MAKTIYQKTSPYYRTPQNNQFLGMWVPTGIQPSSTDVAIQVTQKYNQRPDLLSYDLYGTPRLWWIFAVINPDLIQDPIYDLHAGMQINVPTTASVEVFI
jgi:Base plate wedge protein 53